MRKTPKEVVVNDNMQRNYRYTLTESEGKNFHPDFKPDVTPKEMLELGVFCGKYMRDCGAEFPTSWFAHAVFSETPEQNCKLNYFGVKASQPLKEWRRKGWIYADDPRGWFQWYCRYYMGRRIAHEDARQVKRWKAFGRHAFQVKQNCSPRDLTCRPVQRQALLHWAYDSRAM